MSESLTPGDVQQATQGRLLQSDPETQRILDATLAKARRFCGWHVSPVRQDTVILDYPTRNTLILPTLKVVSLDAISVDGVAVDLNNVRRSREAPGVIGTKDGRPWGTYLPCADPGYGAISVTFTHGFTAAEAADFRDAVLRAIDTASMQVGAGGDGPLEEIKVDDVSYRWPRTGPDRVINSIARNPLDTSTLYQYRILAI